MEEQSKQNPFSDNDLDSPEYRARLLRKLNCLVALLDLAGDDVLPFVEMLMSHSGDETAELAALALGSSLGRRCGCGRLGARRADPQQDLAFASRDLLHVDGTGIDVSLSTAWFDDDVMPRSTSHTSWTSQ